MARRGLRDHLKDLEEFDPEKRAFSIHEAAGLPPARQRGGVQGAVPVYHGAGGQEKGKKIQIQKWVRRRRITELGNEDQINCVL